MTIAQIEHNLQALFTNFQQDEFIYQLLLAYGHPQATIVRLKSGDRRVIFYLEKINITTKVHYKLDDTRVREDVRTRCIFENGTESKMPKMILHF